jgi:hypothetical protein
LARSNRFSSLSDGNINTSTMVVVVLMPAQLKVGFVAQFLLLPSGLPHNFVCWCYFDANSDRFKISAVLASATHIPYYPERQNDCTGYQKSHSLATVSPGLILSTLSDHRS